MNDLKKKIICQIHLKAQKIKRIVVDEYIYFCLNYNLIS